MLSSHGNIQAPVEGRPLPCRLRQMLRIEWLGQTLASICWILSVFVYMP